MQLDDQIREEAVAWAVRTGDPAFGDWEAFEAWLEGSPERALAYDRVAASAAEAADALRAARPIAANDDTSRARLATRRWFGGAIAASLVAVLAYVAWPGGSRAYETGPGETQTIALEDGSRIDLSGATRVVVDGDVPRLARLETGRALFSIRHDEARPFRVIAGDDTLLDVGTVFDVALSEKSLSVAVGEGAVIFNPGRQKVTLSAGQQLRSLRGSDAYEQDAIAPSRVGEWREGRLTFDNATLAEAAAQLEQVTGISFRAADASPTLVSGSIATAPVRDDPRAAGALLGVPVRRDGETWVLGGR